jgi:hypothetical protein
MTIGLRHPLRTPSREEPLRYVAHLSFLLERDVQGKGGGSAVEGILVELGLDRLEGEKSVT